MHALVLRHDLVEREPWVAASLYDALTKAQRRHAKAMRQPHRLSLVWPGLEEERAFFGRDPFHQGLSNNRHDIDLMTGLALEQGLIAEPLRAEAIFRDA